MSLFDAYSFAAAAYSLDEASGTRFDDVGASDLSDNNTVGSAVGMFGSAADFEADDGEYLSCTDNAALSTGDIDFMVRCWVKVESLTALRTIAAKFSADGEWLLRVQTDGQVRFYVQNADAAVVSSSNLSTGTWYLLHAWHDSVANQIGLTINAGTADTSSYSAGITDSGRPFTIGARGDGTDQFDGLVDDFVLLKGYILDSTERTEDYNGGSGVSFAQWGGIQQVGGALGGSFPFLRSLNGGIGIRPAIFAPGLGR